MCSARTIPCGSRAILSIVRPPRRSPNRSPSGPVRSRSSASRRGFGRSPGRRPSMRPSLTGNGTIPIRFAISSITSHSSRASPAGGTTASVYWMNGRRVEAEEGERQVVALVEGRARQDVVRVAVRLVHVEVERHAQLELADRLVERVAVRHGQDRVARGHEQRADLELARRRDLPRQQRRGQVADHVREAAEARAHLAVAGEARPSPPRRRARSPGGRRRRRRARRGCR